MSNQQKIPFYLFPLSVPTNVRIISSKISIDSLLGAASLAVSMNNLQTSILPQEIVTNGKQQIQLTQQLYQIVQYIEFSNKVLRLGQWVSFHSDRQKFDQKKMQSKLEKIYKLNVNYVKSFFFEFKMQSYFRNNKKSRVLPFETRVTKFCIDDYFCSTFNNQNQSNHKQLTVSNHKQLTVSNQILTTFKNILMFKQHLKNISQQIDSNYGDGDNQARKQIDYQILDKHLNNTYPVVLQYTQDIVQFLIPYWELSFSQFTKNAKYLIMSQWKFQNNQSAYLAFWIPLTTVLLLHFMIDQPFQNKSRIYLTAIIQVCLTLATSLIGFVFSKLTDTVFKQYPRHLCVSSFMGLFTLIYCLIGVISTKALLIIESIVFIIICVYFHLGVYNKSMKPTLLQMLGLLVSLIVIYTCAAIAFISIYQPSLNQSIGTLENQNIPKHFWSYRKFNSL